jgi:hypothetical protein
MKTVQTMTKWLGLSVGLLVAGAMRAPAQPEASAQPVVVGRVYDIEGDLLRYVPQTKDWVAVVKDAPFAAEGTLYSGTEGRAELIVPNRTMVRVGNSTQIQFIGLESDLTEVDVASGEVRFANKSDRAVIKATSDFGYVLADAGSVFDFNVGDNSAEVIPIKGTVSFVHSGTKARYRVAAGSASLLADAQQVSSGDGAVDPDWNRWNASRDTFWAEKAQAGRRSVKYLPPALQDDAYVLDENGQWDTVVYEGHKRTFWRPLHVSAEWEPFTVGRWTDWDGDQTWIPAESFGYTTSHYGNWVFVGSNWYWAPPVVSVNVGLPLLDIGFGWNPGRVSWIYTEANVGWVPLAPQETYYSHRNWGGRHSEIIGSANLNVGVNIGNLAFIGHATVVGQNHFYDTGNYASVRVANIDRTTIVSSYRSATVVSNTVIRGYATNNNRYNYTNVAVSEMPHASVIARIDRNAGAIQGGKHERASVVQKQMTSIKEGHVNRDVRIAAPVVTNRIVPASEVNRPQADVKFRQNEAKAKGGQGGRSAKEAKQAQPTKADRQERQATAADGRDKADSPKGGKQDQAAPSKRSKAEPNARAKSADKGSAKDDRSGPGGGKNQDKEDKPGK